MRRTWLGVAMALLLGACSASPSPPSATTVRQETPWRSRIAAAALVEWQDWGRLTVDGWPEALPREADPANYQRILTYWSGVDEGPAVIRRHQNSYDAMMESLAESFPPGEPLPQPSISLFANPAWSAAFISHVMMKAGVPGYVFPPAAAHAFYIDSLLSQAQWNPDTAPFRPHDPAEYAPRTGDLICADRSRAPLQHWQERLSETGRFRPMHCDVVVRTGDGLVQAIGGNVLDAVVLRRFPADVEGRALPPPWDKPPFMLIFENRMDTLPPGQGPIASARIPPAAPAP